MSDVAKVNDTNFDQEVGNHEGVAVVDFFAEWCGPCRFLGPVLDKLAKEYENTGVKFTKLDVDQARGTAMRFGIRAVPTVILFKGGQEVDRILGVLPEPELKNRIEKHR